MSTNFLTNVGPSCGSITCNVSKISWWTLSDTSSCSGISKFWIETFWNALSWNSWTVLSVERWRACTYTRTIIIRKSAYWAVSDTHFGDIIDVIRWLTWAYTYTTSCDILNVKSIRADINTHFNVWICIGKKLNSSITRTVAYTSSCQRISVLICGTLSGLYTKISWVNKCIIGTFSNTSVLNVGESLVYKIILRTSRDTRTIRIKSILPWWTILKTSFWRWFCISGWIGWTHYFINSKYLKCICGNNYRNMFVLLYQQHPKDKLK